jgi:hypothetical protein
MNLYFISGLGADKRVFQNLRLPEPFQINYVEWAPVSAETNMENYCELLSRQIDQSMPFSIIGLSFGGVIAIELSRKLNPVQTVIISSFCFKKEVPKFYIFLGRTRLYKLLPSRMMLRPNGFVLNLFGAKTAGTAKMLRNILTETDPGFFRWAINQLFTWDNSWKPENFLRIHGTDDKILPYRSNMNAITVEGGSHLMVYNKAEIVSEILTQNLHVK